MALFMSEAQLYKINNEKVIYEIIFGKIKYL